MMYSLIVALLFAVTIAGVRSQEYHDHHDHHGAPYDACSSSSKLPLQSGRIPYIVTFNPTTLAPGECGNITFRVRGQQNIQGFVAYVQNSNNETVGTWNYYDCDSHTIDCGSGHRNGISFSNVHKPRSVVFNWTAPDCEGRYYVYIIIVRAYGCTYERYRVRAYITVEQPHPSGQDDCETVE